jgi:hypothetical protein
MSIEIMARVSKFKEIILFKYISFSKCENPTKRTI